MAKAEHSKLRGRRILVVEDMQLIAMDIKDILSAVGCEVVGPAPDVRQALALLAQISVDAAVMDINLGDEEVFPVAEALQGENKPFLFLTGYSNPHLFPAAFQHVPSLEKPFLEEVLLSSLEDLFDDEPSSS